MAKPRRKRANPGPPAPTPLHEPTEWRRQHGRFGQPVCEAYPDTGLTVVHRRAIDTLATMEAYGTITRDMRTAGETMTERAAAAREGWGGRPVGHTQAQGVLVAALGILARHYGLAPRRRAKSSESQAWPAQPPSAVRTMRRQRAGSNASLSAVASCSISSARLRKAWAS